MITPQLLQSFLGLQLVDELIHAVEVDARFETEGVGPDLERF
jgi:hypothetical protein